MEDYEFFWMTIGLFSIGTGWATLYTFGEWIVGGFRAALVDGEVT